MSKTFLNGYTDLLDMVNRPASETEVLAAAKRELNSAIRFLQRDHAYRYTERLTQFTYPANTLNVELEDVCEGSLRDIHSFQLITADGANGGQLLEYKSYQQIQAARLKFQRKQGGGSVAEEWDYVCNTLTHDSYVSRVHRYFMYRMGTTIGMYPVPTADVIILMNAHIWLPDLEEDEDTNFFLEYAYDVVLTLALQRMSIYLHVDNRFKVTQEEMLTALAGLHAWDGQVHESPLTDYP